MRTCENMSMTVRMCCGRGGHHASPPQAMDSAQPQTPTHPQIDTSCSKGMHRHHKMVEQWFCPRLIREQYPVLNTRPIALTISISYRGTQATYLYVPWGSN